MRRAPKPAAPSGRPSYPRLGPAWRVLAGAAPLVLSSLALGDASVPAHVKKPGQATPPLPGQMPAPRVVDATQPNEPKPNEPPPDANRNPKPKPRELPKLMGKIACPRKPPPEPTDDEPAEKPAPKPKEFPRPKGDIARARRPQAPWLLLAANTVPPDAHVIHPHRPDEPCHEALGDDEA